jgi:hypothetical protein
MKYPTARKTPQHPCRSEIVDDKSRGTSSFPVFPNPRGPIVNGRHSHPGRRLRQMLTRLSSPFGQGSRRESPNQSQGVGKREGPPYLLVGKDPARAHPCKPTRQTTCHIFYHSPLGHDDENDSSHGLRVHDQVWRAALEGDQVAPRLQPQT